MRWYIISLSAIAIFIINPVLMVRADDKIEHYSKAVKEYEQSQAQMQKNVAVMALAYYKSKLSDECRRTSRNGCISGAFPGSTVMELAINGLGVNKSAAANDALIDLVVTTVDAGASEDLDCAIVIKGVDILPQLESFNTMERLKNCSLTFSQLKERELRNLADISAEDVCQLNSMNVKDIENRVHDLIHAIKSKTICE